MSSTTSELKNQSEEDNNTTEYQPTDPIILRVPMKPRKNFSVEEKKARRIQSNKRYYEKNKSRVLSYHTQRGNVYNQIQTMLWGDNFSVDIKEEDGVRKYSIQFTQKIEAPKISFNLERPRIVGGK